MRQTAQVELFEIHNVGLRNYDLGEMVIKKILADVHSAHWLCPVFLPITANLHTNRRTSDIFVPRRTLVRSETHSVQLPVPSDSRPICERAATSLEPEANDRHIPAAHVAVAFCVCSVRRNKL